MKPDGTRRRGMFGLREDARENEAIRVIVRMLEYLRPYRFDHGLGTGTSNCAETMNS